MKSTLEDLHVISEYLRTECEAGRVIGPLYSSSYPQVHIHTSRFGVIPKSRPVKWRLIVDMSSQEGGSVNDGIKEP